jgi:hypothetical protein
MNKSQAQLEKDILYKKIIEDYDTGNFKLKDLAEKYNLRYYTISSNIRKRGVLTNSYGKISLNSNIFNKIDTEEKAYWLGFLYADGCIHKNKKGYYKFELGLKESDKNHIEKFKKFISSKHIIKYREKTKSVRLSFADSIFCNDLIKLGCTPKKSLTLSFPTTEQLPKELIRHFIRGYVDGDGSFGLYKTKNRYNCIFSLLGTKSFLENLLKVSNIPFIKFHQDSRHSINTKSISYSGNFCYQILEYLYNDSSIFLDRKHETFLNIKNAKLNKTILNYNKTNSKNNHNLINLNLK